MNTPQTTIAPALLQLLQRLPQTGTFDEHWFLQQVHLFTPCSPQEVIRWALLSGHLELRGISISGSWELAVRNSTELAHTRPLLYTPTSYGPPGYLGYLVLPPDVRTYLSTTRFSCYNAPGGVTRLTLKQLADRLDEAPSADRNMRKALRELDTTDYDDDDLLPYVDFARPWRRQAEFPIDAFQLHFASCVKASNAYQFLTDDPCLASHMLLLMREPIDTGLTVVVRVPEGYANPEEARQVLPNYCIKRFRNLSCSTTWTPGGRGQMGIARPAWRHPHLR